MKFKKLPMCRHKLSWQWAMYLKNFSFHDFFALGPSTFSLLFSINFPIIMIFFKRAKRTLTFLLELVKK